MIRLMKLHEFEYVELKYRHVIFPGGEHHVDLGNNFNDPVLIDARVKNADDFMHLLTLTNALRQAGVKDISLHIPYFPGARQDRPQQDFAFTLKLYADLINQQKYTSVTVLDPHSVSTQILLRNCFVNSPLEYIGEFCDHIFELTGRDISCALAPDLGASKRTQKLADLLHVKCLQGTKTRNPTTGELSDFKLFNLDDTIGYENSDLLVIDDICDGGRTFEIIGEYFNLNFPHIKLWLWVTHGIFSKGFDNLVKYYKGIGSTDSFPNDQVSGLFYYKANLSL